MYSYEEQIEILYNYIVESGMFPENYLDIVCGAFGYSLNTLQKIYYAICGEEFDFDEY